MAVDPKFAVRLVGGVNPTAANLNAAQGDIPLEVHSTHWLVVASGGLPPSATAGYHAIDGGWRRVEIALAQVLRTDAVVAAALEYHRISFHLNEFGRALDRLSTAGAITFVSSGSLDSAMADFACVLRATACGRRRPRG